ncbi:GntR family transcriptional regulator [Streptomyces sparsogenes]|uniref:GntR family transcriptional regulator n=1 Tax=Streptomyces sparsogenes DSM 40356 TaxID=1331668 RepID=A0A1R1S8G7_9ACTN|nr:GntR family transcriptional regulator [Streptomyces sparsogenes]OMI34419.1 GntR family transcriptional regulator [Streptomyces sparsogenes DSM 40356]
MAKHEDKRPVAERIAANIRYLIMSGEWEPGKKLPTTSELMEEHDTSNVTVQRALTILKNEKLLEGRSGKGVYVRDRAPQTITPAAYMAPSEDGQPYRWVTEANRRNQRGSNKILQVAEIRTPKRVAKALGIEEGGTAVLRVRLGLLDDEPAELTYSYYPADLALGTRLADRRKIPGGSPTLLASMGYPTRGQIEEVAARVATTEEYELLEIPGDVPVIEVFRIVYSDDERPIEVTVMVKPGHLYKMGYHLPVS